MALPTGPIPRVAYDEIIAEEWGDSVAQSLNNLNQMHEWVVWSPASGTSFLAETGGLMVNWFTVGGDSDPSIVTVPDWATRALVTYQINAVVQDPTSAGRVSYLMRGRVGTTAGLGRPVRFSGRAGYFQCAWSDDINVDPLDGDRTIKIQAQRIEGTGSERWKLFDESDVAVHLIFRNAGGGPANWYPGL